MVVFLKQKTNKIKKKKTREMLDAFAEELFDNHIVQLPQYTQSTGTLELPDYSKKCREDGLVRGKGFDLKRGEQMKKIYTEKDFSVEDIKKIKETCKFHREQNEISRRTFMGDKEKKQIKRNIEIEKTINTQLSKAFKPKKT